MKKEINRHHVVPRERHKNGTVPTNEHPLLLKATIRMDVNRHFHFHGLFGNMTLSEAIIFLTRLRYQTLRKAHKLRKKNLPKPLNEMYFIKI